MRMRVSPSLGAAFLDGDTHKCMSPAVPRTPSGPLGHLPQRGRIYAARSSDAPPLGELSRSD